ncbi:MAG: hypothetical protein ACI97A_002267 [Planctomycetota bacterium]
MDPKEDSPLNRRLIIQEDSGQSVYDLIDAETMIGRDEQCDLPLPCDRLSRHHLKFTLLGDDLLIEDQGSSNGTRVNGDILKSKILVESGDKVELGSITIWIDQAPVRSSSASGPPATRRAAADRKPKNNNSLAIVVSIVAVLGSLIYLNRPEENARDRLNRKKEDRTQEQAKKTPSRGPSQTVQRSGVSRFTEAERNKNLARSQALSDLDFALDSYLLQNDYISAYEALEEFSKKHGKPGRAGAKRVSDAITTAFNDAVGAYQKHIGAGAPELGRALIGDRLNRFPEGSEFHAKLKNILDRPLGDSSEVVAKKVTARNPATATDVVPVISKPVAQKVATKKSEREAAEKRFLAETVSADRYFGQRRYAEAARGYRRSSEAGLTAQVDHELLRIAMRRMRQSERLAAFALSIESKIKSGPSIFGQVTFLPGKRGEIKGIGESGIIFDDGETTIELPFRVLRSETLKSLITKSDFTGVERINAATFLMTMDDIEVAEKLLYRTEANSPNLKTVIDSALADARSIEIPDQGFTYRDGQYLSPGDVARVKIRETVEDSLPKLTDKSAKVRAEAYSALRGLGDRAASSFHRALIQSKSTLLANLKTNDNFKKLVIMDEQRLAVNKSRKHALKLIFDTVKYPYPYRGVSKEVSALYFETSKEVALRVRALRELWKNPASVKIDSSLRLAITQMQEYNVELDRLELGRGLNDPRCLLYLPKGNQVTMATYAIDDVDRERIDSSLASVKFNATTQSMATAAEKQQVAVTNEYRLMFGRHAVRIHEKLVACARMHSTDMGKGGFFAHDNPLDPKKRSPNDRARMHDFFGGVSENIAGNGGGAIGAHNAWIGSSGHHRNILGVRWRYLGSGNSGNLWTQNFSRGDSQNR